MATKKNKPEPTGIKQYIGITRDHSMSMHSLKQAAMRDYNTTISGIKDASEANDIDTIVSVVRCGCGSYGRNEREVVNSAINRLKPLETYVADGHSTPLYDSVGELIEILSLAPDAKDPNVSFLVTVITDGEENSSHRYNAFTLAKKIRELQATDRWTFTFRVPKGYKNALMHSLGIPEGNIMEWEQSERGFKEATIVQSQAFTSYFSSVKSGVRGSTRFYTDLSNVRPSDVRSEMKNVTSEVTFWPVRKESVIKDFVEKKLGHSMNLGCAFYQLSKPEKAVQDYKLIAIRNRKSAAVYVGDEARDLLGLPKTGNIKLAPGTHGDFDVFIQSTSTNRKLMPNTEVLYWPNANKI